ncbi:hypothetical protein [Streptomyces sp. DB-54]
MSLTVSQTVAAPDGAAPASADQSGLVYELTTQPDPLRVSPAQGALEHGDIVIVGSALNFNTSRSSASPSDFRSATSPTH